MSQRGRQPRLHNKDLRRSRAGKFFKQTWMSPSTSGFGALRLRELRVVRMAIPQKSRHWCEVQLLPQRPAAPPQVEEFRPPSPAPPLRSCCGRFRKDGATCEDAGCTSVAGLIGLLMTYQVDFVCPLRST